MSTRRRSRHHRRAAVAAAILVAVPLVAAAPASGDGHRRTVPAPLCTPEVPRAVTLVDRDAVPAAHGASVDCLLLYGVTRGAPTDTAALAFRPAVTVTREQAASLLARTVTTAGGTLPAPGPAFPDVGPTHAEAAQRLRAAGIMSGRADGTFGPAEPLTRGQAASLLLRTVAHLRGVAPATLAGGGSAFTDLGGSVHREAVEGAARLGLVAGTSRTTFEPGRPLTRAQAASLLARVLSREPAAVQECTLTGTAAAWRLRHPVGWTAAGDPPCTVFGPAGTAAVTVREEARPLAAVVDPGDLAEIDLQLTTEIGGRFAVRQQRLATGEGDEPLGARSLLWAVSHGPRTLVLTGRAVPGLDHDAVSAVLDRTVLALTAPADPAAPFTPVETVLSDPSSTAGLGLVAVRTAAHPGQDRVVLEFAGTGLPGWRRAAWVERSASGGSGEPITVSGSGRLELLVDGVGYPDDTGVPHDPALARTAARGGVALEVVVDPVFEAQQVVVVGTTQPVPWRVTRLAGPPRLVVDLARP